MDFIDVLKKIGKGEELTEEEQNILSTSESFCRTFSLDEIKYYEDHDVKMSLEDAMLTFSYPGPITVNLKDNSNEDNIIYNVKAIRSYAMAQVGLYLWYEIKKYFTTNNDAEIKINKDIAMRQIYQIENGYSYPLRYELRNILDSNYWSSGPIELIPIRDTILSYNEMMYKNFIKGE